MVYYYYYFKYIMMGCRDFFSFVPVLLLSLLRPLFLPSSSVYLSYFIIAFSIREYFGKHSFMSLIFSVAILNDTCFFPTVQLQVHNVYSVQKPRNSQVLVNLNF